MMCFGERMVIDEHELVMPMHLFFSGCTVACCALCLNRLAFGDEVGSNVHAADGFAC